MKVPKTRPRPGFLKLLRLFVLLKAMHWFVRRGDSHFFKLMGSQFGYFCLREMGADSGDLDRLRAEVDRYKASFVLDDIERLNRGEDIDTSML